MATNADNVLLRVAVGKYWVYKQMRCHEAQRNRSNGSCRPRVRDA